jgi:hypothetical protein
MCPFDYTFAEGELFQALATAHLGNHGIVIINAWQHKKARKIQF